MSSKSERFNAKAAIFFSGCCCCCCFPVAEHQYLDVRVRNNGQGTARITNALISVYQAGTDDLVVLKATDEYGDAIFRLASGNYKVRAQKAWHIPESADLDNIQLDPNDGRIVRFNKQSLHFFLHVDADRNGIVDDAPEAAMNTAAPAWAWGAGRRGAVIPVNVDDDDAKNAGDYSDNIINGTADRDSDIAHIEIKRDGMNNPTPDGWAATLSVASPAGEANPHHNVRIFDGVAMGAAQLIGPTAPQAVVPNFDANPKQLGMAALRYAGGTIVGVPPLDAPFNTPFDGIVTVRLTITCPDPLGGVNLSYFTEVQMRAASWIMPNHLERADTVYVSRLDAIGGLRESDTFIAALNPLVTNLPPNGAGGNLVENDQTARIPPLDQWMQDCMEIGYSTWPGTGGGVLRMESAMEALRDGNLHGYPQELRGVNFGYSYPGHGGAHHTFDSTGNLEVTPPVRAGGRNYRWGRIYYGRGRPAQLFNPATREFLERQIVQSPIPLNTDWLAVGHVDEMMTFIPTPDTNRPWNKQWRLLIASPRCAYRILQAAPIGSVVMSGRQLEVDNIMTPVNTSVGEMMGNTDSMLRHPGLPAGNVLTWQQLREWNLGPLQRVINRVRDSLIATIGLNVDQDVIEVPVVFMPESLLAGGPGLPFAGGLDANGLNVLPGTPGGFTSGALTADMVNMLVVNGHLIVPQPFGPENPLGTDLFAADLNAKIAAVNTPLALANKLTVNYIDDWVLYHANCGEVHCGTNTLRKPANVVNWCLNDAKARWWEYPGP